MKTTASQVDDDFGMNILFVVLTLVTYLTSFASGQIVFMTKAGFLFVACGLLYLVLGVVTLPRYQQKGVRATYLHLLLQLLVGALIYYLSRGQGWLIMLPVLGQSVEVLPARERNLMLFLHLLVVLGVTILLVNPGGAAGTHLSFWVAVLISVLQYALAAVFVVLFTLVAVRERAARAEVEELAAQLESANRKLRAYTAQVEELAVVKERNRLAREIHDGLGHYLTAINMQIQAGLSVLDHDRARALTALAHAQQLTQEGLSEVRRSVAALRASSLDKFSLAEAVEKLLTACSASGLKTVFQVEGEPYPLAAQIALIIYRAAQEGLTNVCKHAQAEQVLAKLIYGNCSLTLIIEDDGVGTEEPGGGFGLQGIQERLRLVSGKLRIETGDGRGFRLEVEVPTS